MNARTAMLVASDPTGISQYSFIAGLIEKFGGQRNDKLWQDGLRMVGDVLLTARGPNEVAPQRFARLVSGGNAYEILETISQLDQFKKNFTPQLMRSLRGMTAVEMGEALRKRGENRDQRNSQAAMEASPVTFSAGI